MRLRARRLQVRALKRTAAFPSGVFGPVECCAFCRLDSCCSSEINIGDSLFGVRGSSPIPRFHDRVRVVGKGRVTEVGELVSCLVCWECGGKLYFLSLWPRSPGLARQLLRAGRERSGSRRAAPRNTCSCLLDDGHMLRYQVAFHFPRAQGETVVAEALDFLGAVSQGFDLPDARLMIASAMADLAELLLEEGKPLPTPNL